MTDSSQARHLPIRVFTAWRGRTLPALRRHRLLAAALLAALLGAAYWLLIASDRYVSEAHAVIQRTDLGGGPAVDFSSLLGGAVSGSQADQLLLRDHLLSVDMLQKLDAALGLRAHYSDRRRDPLSRMWFPDASMEWFHRHYLARVDVDFDAYAGVLVIKAEAYDPRTAQAIVSLLLREGEDFMNEMAHGLARNQVAFLESQVGQMSERAAKTRQAVLAYQNREGLVSPEATAENIAAIVAKLEAQRSELQTQRNTLLGYLVASHPSVVQLDQQMAAVARQIALEQARLAAPAGRTLNRAVEEFQRLQMEAGFAQEIYRGALVALEKGRLEAARTIKKMSVLQAPTRPEYPLEPRRFYNTLVFALAALLLAGVAHLLTAIVREHKD